MIGTFIIGQLLKPYVPTLPAGPAIELSPGLIELLAIILPFIIIFLEFSLLYLVIFRGVRTWHGSEHKLISAMENDDIDNAEKYDPIHERCGGTLMPTIIVAGICWSFVVTATGFPFGQFTFMSFFIFLNVRYFHKYDKVGIWFGKWLQRHATVSEPEPWKINLGRIAVKQLVKAENGDNFRESAVLIK